MPRISRPQSNIARNIALRQAINRKDAVPPMPIIPYSPATIAWLDTFQPLYKAAFDAVSEAKQTQTNLTAQVSQAKKIAIYNEQDFVLNLNRGIRREIFTASARTYYNIALDNDKALKVNSESELLDINDVLTTGEANRIADGGTAITFPSIGQVNTAVSNFVTLNNAQGPAKFNFDTKQEAIAAMNPEADKLILKLWNETETAFDEGDKPSMRRKCREWGVVYVPSPGEAPGPEDFSIIGTTTDSVTGLPIDNVAYRLLPPDVLLLGDAQGKYFIGVLPAGTYSLEAVKPGYEGEITTGIVVTDGAITTVNFQLTPETTGSISGTVTQGGVAVPASITITGIPGGVTTDPSGNYVFNDIPAGTHNVRAELDSNPSIFQTQTITIMPGITTTVNFIFP